MRKVVFSRNGYDFVKFTPTMIKHYDSNVYQGDDEPDYLKTISHYFRMLFEKVVNKCIIIYLYKNEKCYGHAIIGRGGHFLDSTKADIIIGPIWIIPSMRSQGLGTFLIENILSMEDIHYVDAYKRISKSNIASIKAAQKNSFAYIGDVKRIGLMKRLVLSENGGWVVYEKKHTQDEDSDYL